MFLLEPDSPAVISPTDLRVAGACEFALLRRFDVVLGRGVPLATEDDPVMARAKALGDAHEQRYLRQLRADRRVVGVDRPRETTRAAYEQAADATLLALASDADVVYQAAFFDGRFHGFADFVVREETGWTIVDTKLARTESVPALLQIAAYAVQLADAGVPTSPWARLVLGDGQEHDTPLTDIVPVYRERRARMERVLDSHQASGLPVAWGDERWLACGRCEECQAQLEATRDVLLVAGVRTSHRAKLAAVGVHTVADLAARVDPVPELSASSLARLREQARLQSVQDADPLHAVTAQVHDPETLAVLPAPSPGDIFFDFEGDPMWSEPGSPDWGLEYLFGVVEAPVDGAEPAFRAFWAHDRAQEKQALVDFLGYVAERRRRWPDLHIYHYAAYERTALLRLAVRHGVGEADVDNLLRAGVFVDLYAVVRGAIRVSQRSYSLKKLEPLYMGEQHRDDEGVTTAGDSIVVYHEFSQAVIEERCHEAERLIEQIREYNEYDCLSTLRLRDWLIDRATEAGVTIGGVSPSTEEPEEPNALEAALRAFVPVGTGLPRTADEQAVAMLAATVQYNRREHKPYWWSHFDRLRNPVDEWVRGSDVFHVESGSVLQPWGKEGNQRSLRRRLRLDVRSAGGSAVSEGARLQAIYDRPLPPGLEPLPGHLRAKSGDVTVLDRGSEEAGTFLVIEETLPRGVAQHDCLPLALTPTPPPATRSIDEAIEELAAAVVSARGALFAQPGLDLLRRLPPRTRSGSLPVVSGEGDDRFADAITAAVLDLDRSYLGVQGPPGTGKTHVAAQVITRLVRDHGWKVGVVAQSHAAVENVLAAVVKAGLDPVQVAKNPKEADPTRGWTEIGKDDLAAYTSTMAGVGYVIGGTAWDLTSTKRIGRDQLDLVVVDEAGQYSLAATIACSMAGSRLLLLGDPQQLPQVSQGTHPEPVDGSALGWLLGDEPVMPASLGYFLETTWRMHPALTDKVSTLSYAGALRSKEARTTARSLAGIEPGLHVVRVEHRDNTTESVEEADAVARLVADLVGRDWVDPDEADGIGGAKVARPLTTADIRVVTPYNAQVARIREVLESAGHGDVAVASVDKFQGQEAAVIIVSMAASAAADVSRGLGFLLSRNRLNVAISRGKWAAYVVRSDVLTDFSPRTPGELVALGAFIGLCEPDLTSSDREQVATASG